MDMVASKSGEKDTRLNREAVLRDFVRFSWKATRGLTSVAEAEGKDLIRRMVEIGRITSDEGDKISTALMGRMKRSREQFQGRVDKSVLRAAEKLGAISEDELDKLTQHATKLEKRLEVLLLKKRGK